MDPGRESEEEYSEERTDSDEVEHSDVLIEDDFNNQIQFYQPGQLYLEATNDIDSHHKKKPKCQTILYQNHIIVFGSEIVAQDTSEILLYNINNQEWKTITPKGNLEVNTNLEYTVCKLSPHQLVVYGAPLLQTQTMPLQPTPIFRGAQPDYQTCCQVLNLVDTQNMDERESSGIAAEWETGKKFGYELPFMTNTAVNVVEKTLYLYGGQDKGRAVNLYLHTADLETFKGRVHRPPPSNTPMPYDPAAYPGARQKHSGTVYKGKIYYYGGFDIQGKAVFDIWSLHVHTMKWELIKQKCIWPKLVVDWFARCEEDRIIFLGGPVQKKDDQNSEILTYKISTGNWEISQAKINFSSGPNKIFEVYKNTIIYGEPLNLDQIALNQNTGQNVTKENNSFSKSDRKLFEEKLYSDVSFKVGDTIIQAHKALLMTRCQYFNDLFEKSNNSLIEIEDIKGHIFNGLLEYLYCGDIQKLNEDVSVELLKLTDKFQIFGLKEYCEQFLLKKLRVENVVDFTNLADSCQAKALKDGGIHFIAENFENIFKKCDIKQLSNANLFGIFKLFKANKH